MSDSYAGITTPEGSVSELRHAGSRLAQQAQMLAQSSQQLRTMPASAGMWTGPAHGAYANRCITASTAAQLAAQSFIMAAGAAEAYADELSEAKHEAREAIKDARHAQDQIDKAQDGIEDAQGRAIAAQGRIDAALHIQAVSTMGGADGGMADAMLQQAINDLNDAQEDERRWTKILHEAKDDLREAKRRGHRAEEKAKDAAATARTLFAAAGSAMPILTLPGAPAEAKVKDTRHWYEKAADWTWDQASAVPGAAKDATVDMATGLAGMVADNAEYQYNKFFHPGLAMQYEMRQQQAMNAVINHPLETGKAIVNWDDLSSGRIGEWVGGFAPDAVITVLTAGGGAAVRTARGTQKVSELGGTRALTRSQEAFDKATDAHKGLAPPSGFDSKTVAATRKPTLSGWVHDDLQGFEYIRPEEVKRMADDMNFDIRGAGAADHAGSEPGWTGKHHASHAEAKHLARNPGQPVGVDRNMCSTCQDMYQQAADYSRQPLLVQDPDHTRLYLPGHDPIVDPKPSDFPDAVPITPEDVKRGAAAGGGAAVAGPDSGP
jgi:hypothetical protein